MLQFINIDVNVPGSRLTSTDPLVGNHPKPKPNTAIMNKYNTNDGIARKKKL